MEKVQIPLSVTVRIPVEKPESLTDCKRLLDESAIVEACFAHVVSRIRREMRHELDRAAYNIADELMIRERRERGATGV